jgi:hypothetical protein
MAYEDDARRVADRLVHLITNSGPVTVDELAVVDMAGSAVRQLCGQILADLKHDNPHRGSPLSPLTEPALHVLRRLLKRDPTALVVGSDASADWASSPHTEHGEHWRELQRSAMLAAHEWSLIYPQAIPSGREAWPYITDVAAIAEALALAELDLQIADGAETVATRDKHSRALAFVAEHVRRLSPPDLPPGSAPLPSRRRHMLLRVRSISDAPAAAARLATLLHNAGRLRPESVRTIARAHADHLLRLAKLLEQDRRPDRRSTPLIQGLRQQATKLEDLASEAQNYRALEPDDPRPIQQLHLLRDRWRQTVRSSEASRTAIVRYLPPALAVVNALRDAIEQQVDNGHWYIRVEEGRYGWQRTNASTRPPIFAVAREASAQADELVELAPSIPPSAAKAAPRETLADRLQAHGAPVVSR